MDIPLDGIFALCFSYHWYQYVFISSISADTRRKLCHLRRNKVKFNNDVIIALRVRCDRTTLPLRPRLHCIKHTADWSRRLVVLQWLLVPPRQCLFTYWIIKLCQYLLKIKLIHWLLEVIGKLWNYIARFIVTLPTAKRGHGMWQLLPLVMRYLVNISKVIVQCPTALLVHAVLGFQLKLL